MQVQWILWKPKMMLACVTDARILKVNFLTLLLFQFTLLLLIYFFFCISLRLAIANLNKTFILLVCTKFFRMPSIKKCWRVQTGDSAEDAFIWKQSISIKMKEVNIFKKNVELPLRTCSKPKWTSVVLVDTLNTSLSLLFTKWSAKSVCWQRGPRSSLTVLVTLGKR